MVLPLRGPRIRQASLYRGVVTYTGNRVTDDDRTINCDDRLRDPVRFDWRRSRVLRRHTRS